MPGLTLGSAPDSWGVWFADDPKQIPWERFLDEIAEAGYGWTELGPYGYLPTDVDVLRGELDRRDLQLAGAFVMFDLEGEGAWERNRAEAEQTAALAQALGGRYLVIIDGIYTDVHTGELLLEAELDDAAWARLVDSTRRLCELAATHGMRPVFHPHTQTHVEYERQIERLLQDAPEVDLCLDVGHHAYCGGEPVAFFRRHRDRIPYLHLKSVDRELRARVAREGIPFGEGVAQGVFVEPSEGMVDFEALRDAIGEAGYEGFGIVEQDMYPTDFDRPLPVAKRTHAYLRELGLG